jgi:hypothetical protein
MDNSDVTKQPKFRFSFGIDSDDAAKCNIVGFTLNGISLNLKIVICLCLLHRGFISTTAVDVHGAGCEIELCQLGNLFG